MMSWGYTNRAFVASAFGRFMLSGKVGLLLAVLTGVAAFVTYSSFSRPISPEHMSYLLTFDLALLGMLCLVVGWHVVVLLRARKRGMAGAKLHLKLVMAFIFLAVTPALVVAGAGGYLFFAGIQTWFSESVSGAVRESREVADAALEAYQSTIVGDALSVAGQLNRISSADEDELVSVLNNTLLNRGLSDAFIFDANSRIVARSTLGFSIGFETIRDVDLERARVGDVVVMSSEDNARARALVRLDRYNDNYLLISRLTDPKILGHRQMAEDASARYTAFETRRLDLQRGVLLVFVVVGVALLLGAVLLGMNIAGQIIQPISELIRAADRVRGGDLSVRVQVTGHSNELSTLIRSFNRMTNQLQGQRRELIETNRQLEERTRFTEAVLAGVSAGILDMNSEGVIQLANTLAGELLGVDAESLVGQPVLAILPEMEELFVEAHRRPGRQIEQQVALKRAGLGTRTFHVRMAPELAGDDVRGYVLTFDEITALVSAQRMAAWADVARRIAHEIKNPLTPIQLSAERLKRKYLSQISEAPEIFQDCIDIIVRQVDDIRRMVDEFSSFARMPAAVIKPHNMCAIVREVLSFERSAHSQISFNTDLPAQDVNLLCDHRQIRQALLNLVQNACNAIEEREDATDLLPNGQITVSLRQHSDSVVLSIIDNGKGLPKDEREKLTEPYVTTRTKGTGLGLAIVKKIMEDHGGNIDLMDNPTGGAIVQLVFPIASNTGDTTAPDVSNKAGFAQSEVG
jgi:two-component system nitrogen regulation sensor histidine kinase NtrY